ncbi:hypothetical protein BC629DRAFT_1518042 [Irpex lacteus]|nr:hypothetical protein BC629DRAFT_1518042 [Irpex lacteus]
MSALENFVKYADLWFEDGNVVLVAEESGYRVHRSLLARHSDVFRDMFSMPQPPPTEEGTYEGCPTVMLVGDRAKEVTMILTILYDGGRSFYNDSAPLPGETAIATLRLGTKYGFSDIKQEAMRRISICYPKELRELQEHGQHVECDNTCPVIWNKENAVAVFSLARQLGLDDLLQAAFYRCCMLSCRWLFLSAAESLPQNLYFVLTPQELQDCITFKTLLHVENVKLYKALQGMAPCNMCPNRERGQRSPCIKTIHAFILDSLRLGDVQMHDALSPLDALIVSFVARSPPKRSLCDSCADAAHDIVFANQEMIWAGMRNNDYSREEDQPMDSDDVA